MTIALWCILAAALLPYLFTLVSKGGGKMPRDANRDVRSWQETLQTGWPKRAHAIQLNSFETFPAFAVAVLVAHVVRGPNGAADALALAYIGLRLLYAACYLADKATFRSLIWFLGQACVVGLFIVAARAPAVGATIGTGG